MRAGRELVTVCPLKKQAPNEKAEVVVEAHPLGAGGVRFYQLFADREFLDQISFDLVPEAAFVADRDRSFWAYFNFRTNDVLRPVALGRGYIAGQTEILKG